MKPVGPARLDQLFGPHHAQFAVGHIARDGAACGDDGVCADLYRRDQGGVRADEGAFADLKEAVNNTVLRLGRTLNDVTAAASALTAAAGQVSSTSQSLSQSASEQAASVEETSASLQQMGASVKQNAKS